MAVSNTLVSYTLVSYTLSVTLYLRAGDLAAVARERVDALAREHVPNLNGGEKR